MLFTTLLPLVIFLMTVAFLVAVYNVALRDDPRMNERLESLSEQNRSAPPHDSLWHSARPLLLRLGGLLLPNRAFLRDRIQKQVVQAGLYHGQAMAAYLSVKMAAIVLPWAVGLTVGFLGVVPLRYGIAAAVTLSFLGMIGCDRWLARRKARRQGQLRRVLPDLLDVMTICLEGGLGLQAVMQRVTAEFRSIHTPLGLELSIVQREIQLGQPIGEAVRGMAVRTDLEEVACLASIFDQAERFGTGLAKPIRNQSESLRYKRVQQAEEAAHKAATKILFPTLLFIFPCVFVILVGPAVFQILELLGKR